VIYTEDKDTEDTIMSADIPLNRVTTKLFDSSSILRRGKDTPHAEYEFGNGRKRFLDINQGQGIYEKPVSVTEGETTHLPDTDLSSTIYQRPAPYTVGR
jgi:hypothetical protein